MYVIKCCVINLNITFLYQKGQHLETFLQDLIASTETGKAKSRYLNVNLNCVPIIMSFVRVDCDNR